MPRATTKLMRPVIDRLLYLYCVKGLSGVEIADEFGWSAATVFTRISLLRKENPHRVIKHVEDGKERLLPVVIEKRCKGGRRLTKPAVAIAPETQGRIDARSGYQRKPKAEASKRESKQVSCLMCGRKMLSRHAGQRVCGPCKGSSAWRDGYVDVRISQAEGGVILRGSYDPETNTW